VTIAHEKERVGTQDVIESGALAPSAALRGWPTYKTIWWLSERARIRLEPQQSHGPAGLEPNEQA
jgi:hypothetical protein